MITVATCFWSPNKFTHRLSGIFTEEWVERLHRNFRRHLTLTHRFVVFTERERKFSKHIVQERLSTDTPDYSSFTEPYRLNEPMILVGLDTLVVKNIDNMAEWCLNGDKIALIRDVKSVRLKDKGYPYQGINGVAFVPAGWRRIYDEWTGENDMEHIRKYPWECIDDRWPGCVLSYKMDIRSKDKNILPPDCRIVYFHGQPKIDSLKEIPWVQEHWYR